MTTSQIIQFNCIIKKLEDVKKELNELAYHQAIPLNKAEQENVEEAFLFVTRALNCL